MITTKQLCEFSEAVRKSTLKRLELVPVGFENWRMSTKSLSFAELAQHLIDADNVMMDGIKKGRRDDCLPEAGSLNIKERSEFSRIIKGLESTLVLKK